VGVFSEEPDCRGGREEPNQKPCLTAEGRQETAKTLSDWRSLAGMTTCPARREATYLYCPC